MPLTLPSNEDEWWAYAQIHLNSHDKLATIKYLTNVPAGQKNERSGKDLSGSTVKIGDWLQVHAIWKRPYKLLSPMDAHKSALETLISNRAITPHANAEVIARLFLEVGPSGLITSKICTYPDSVRGFFYLAAAMDQSVRNLQYLDINWLHGFHHAFGIFEQIEEGILRRQQAADETYITIFFHALVEAISGVLHPGGAHHKLEAKREPLHCTSRKDLHPATSIKYFSAFIDGYIQAKGSSSVSGSPRPFLVMCEFKRASLLAAGQQVWMQETFEAAAVISKILHRIFGAFWGKTEKECLQTGDIGSHHGVLQDLPYAWS
ncbi:hypothetical protein CONLIGDRAFT_686656 [Coniochaeta ligniaria NRRL 30616]|uniref:Uncharacterized protein n=1 Tax=Coniochaeta ligniaria NRRL 30616 TaxID=1408157 RepID=A0A1J7IQ27_9PEZI|nr:hypothetical protein CONLIGDRAFT_686656 [Coniochaeta ligniaria NRRL 30616]